jgi:hypothetical protein
MTQAAVAVTDQEEATPEIRMGQLSVRFLIDGLPV